MRRVGSWLSSVLLATGVAASAFAQGGDGYWSYSAHYYPHYPRPFNNSYHGYWRDLGYGFSRQPYYGGNSYPQGHIRTGPGKENGKGRGKGGHPWARPPKHSQNRR
jgi:hypothetical protein